MIQIRDNRPMAEKAQSERPNCTGLYYAREARRMSRSELVRLSGVSKQQLSRLENGPDPAAARSLEAVRHALGYTPEQMLLWGRYPGTRRGGHIESSDVLREEPATTNRSVPLPARCRNSTPAPALAAAECRRAKCARTDATPTHLRPKDGCFRPVSCASSCTLRPPRLLVLDTNGDSMAPTIMSGERVIVDTGHKTPTPDGLYAIRDTFECIVVKRLQLLRSSRPTRVKIISDNPNHPSEEIPLNEVEIVGKVLCCLKLF